MRIAHLSTYDLKGGAARSAWRLHEGLRELGLDSRMLVKGKSSGSDSVAVVPPQNGFSRRVWDLVHRGYIESNRTSLSDTWFSSGYPGHPVEGHPWIQDADVVNLHWVAHFQSTPTVAALGSLGKPIVWTLHDQRPFTGGCHFSAGCDGFERTCHPCPQLLDDPWRLPQRNQYDQRALLPPVPITVVAPSRWLAEAARRSATFAGNRVEVIPYGIDTVAFSKVPKAEARQRFGVSASSRCVLFGAASIEKRKGSDLLVGALQRLEADKKLEVEVLYFGKKDPALASLGSKTRHLGFLKSDEELAAAYSAADVFMLPSLEDNLPNTMLEALACGTPVAAFRVGGIPDQVEDHVTGRLASAVDADALACITREMLEKAEETARMGAEGERRMKTEGSLASQAKRYLELYRSLDAPVRMQATDACRVGPRVREIIVPLVVSSLRKSVFGRKR